MYVILFLTALQIPSKKPQNDADNVKMDMLLSSKFVA